MRYGLLSIASLLCAALAIGFQGSVSYAQGVAGFVQTSDNGTSANSTGAATAHRKASASAANREPGAAGKRYFVEFRARNAESYGHFYVMYGEVNEQHEVIKSEIAGFFPAGDTQNCENCSVYNWTLGHVVPVPSEIGASDGDLEEKYVLARFRVWLTADQYRRLVAYINERKAHKGPWMAFFNNCVTFGRDVASFLGLKMPLAVQISPAVVMYPKDLVIALREANGVYREQAPLKDASGALPRAVTEQSAPADDHKTAQQKPPATQKPRTSAQKSHPASPTGNNDAATKQSSTDGADPSGRVASSVH